MNRMAAWTLAIGLLAVPPGRAQERGQGPSGAAGTEERMDEEEARLAKWNWANFIVLAGVIGYFVSKNGGPFFAARSRQIRKEMVEAAEVRKDAEERAAMVDEKLANLAADIARLKLESQQEREAETERLRRHRETERAKIQEHAQREIESAGKAARLELKRYAAVLAVGLAEQKIRARMNGEIQDELVSAFVRDVESTVSAAGARK